MKLVQIKKDCYYFEAPVTIGYVRNEDNGLLIDAGIDKSTMKKALRQLEEKEYPITHLFITHAHADHYGGAAYLQEQKKVYTIAPVFEAAILENPMLEPLYLFGGNDPLPELRNKFLEGKPIQVDEALEEGSHDIDGFSFETYHFPGHSYYQMGLKIHSMLYAGDSYFSEEQLHKHRIPYITDAYATIESLNKLLTIDCQGGVPGHGVFEKDFSSTVKANIEYHRKCLDWILHYIKDNSRSVSHETLVAEMCQAWNIRATQLSQWLLYRTAVTAYTLGLVREDKLEHSIDQGKWVFKLKGEA